jgi:hypothetical protein
MSEENNLFEGLQIMSPEELNSAVKETNSEDVGTNEDSKEGLELFKPVLAETGDSDNTEKVIKPNNNSDSNENRNEVVYKALMKELVNTGVLTVEEMEKLDEMPGTLDSIKELVNKTVETNFNAKQENWKKGLSSEKKRFLEIEDAFDETDHAILMAQRLEFFENVTEEDISDNVQLQQQIYYEQLIAKNFTHEQAVEAIEDATAVNKLQDKALKAIPELKSQAKGVVQNAKDSKEAKTKAEIEAQTEAFKQLLSNIDARDNFIEGLNLNKISKDKLKNNIMNPIYKDPKSGKEFNSLMYKQQRNPVEFEMLINYYDTLGLFNLDKEGKFKPDISKLKTVAKTAAITELDRVIAAEDERGVGRNTSVETSQKTEGILSLLEKAVNKK